MNAAASGDVSPGAGVRYDRSPQEWRRCVDDPGRAAEARTWLRSDTLDAWRHRRLWSQIDPFLRHHPGASWLTVGDGRFGADAHYINSGGSQAHATDIDDTLLRIGAEQGFIDTFSVANAEALGFADASVDYVLCKESFHHFPRPWIALYEMLRVARHAVVLIEPADPWIQRAGWPPLAGLADRMKQAGRRLARKAPRPPHRFESVGNYVFTLSPWECEKVLLGLHQRHLAWRGVNDYYLKGVEFCPIEGGNEADRRLRRRLFRLLRQRDALSRITGVWGMNVIALFNTPAAPALAAGLQQGGWTVRELPANPHR